MENNQAKEEKLESVKADKPIEKRERFVWQKFSGKTAKYNH